MRRSPIASANFRFLGFGSGLADRGEFAPLPSSRAGARLELGAHFADILAACPPPWEIDPGRQMLKRSGPPADGGGQACHRSVRASADPIRQSMEKK